MDSRVTLSPITFNRTSSINGIRMVHPFILKNIKLPRLGYLVDSDYDGDEGVAVLRFLDPNSQTIFDWYDNTGHLSFLLTDASLLETVEELGRDKDYVKTEDVVKYDAVLDEDVTLRKVFATNPLAIGGDYRRGRSFRNILQENHQIWEAWVRYHSRYCYDNGFEVGMPYLVTEEAVRPYVNTETEERIENVIQTLHEEHGVALTDELRHWVRIFEYSLPAVKLTSVDIEVLPEDPNRMPNANIADQPIIAVSFKASTGKRIVLLLRRQGLSEDGVDIEADQVTFFEQEKELVARTFRIMEMFPFVATFNGDDFDFRYLYNRATQLGIPRFSNPIYIVRNECKLKHGIHIDLYQFFKHPSIQVYAFQGKYRSFGLDEISKALLGKGKIDYKGDEDWVSVGDLSYTDLGRYCLNDSELTYELLTFKNNVTLNLILTLAKMANLPVPGVVRQKISSWIRSMFYYILIKKNILIPSQEQLRSKGEAQTVPKIKGKKYEGAIVKEPSPGIHFNVTVLDYQSLYPSIVKERNIGYSSLNCSHLECRGNTVPGTTHHICIKNRAIEADVIGSLRDIRVLMYKPRAKDKSLIEDERSFYSVLEQAIKVFLNASYGVFGNEGFALFCILTPEATAAFSREAMQLLMDKCEKTNVNLLYADTDSAALKNPTEEEMNILQQWALDTLRLDLGIDKVYRYVVFSHRKKNYLGVYEDGTLDIKGLTGKKVHIPDIVKKPFFEVTELLGKIEREEEFDLARKEIQTIVRNVYYKLRDKEWENMKELAFHTRLGRHPNSYETNPQHVKAARMLMELGHDVRGGDTVHYVKTTNLGGVMPLVDADPNFINVDAYVDQLESVFAQLLEPLQIDFGSDVTGLGMTLDNYPSEKGVVKPSLLVDFMR